MRLVEAARIELASGQVSRGFAWALPGASLRSCPSNTYRPRASRSENP